MRHLSIRWLQGIGHDMRFAARAAAKDRSMLIGTSPHDPATFVATSLALVTVVLVAAVIPARHAARIDPAIALRYE